MVIAKRTQLPVDGSGIHQELLNELCFFIAGKSKSVVADPVKWSGCSDVCFFTIGMEAKFEVASSACLLTYLLVDIVL